MSEIEKSTFPLKDQRMSLRDRKALAGAVMGGIGLVYVVEGGNKAIVSRRSAMLFALGAASGYFLGPITPTLRAEAK
jgi:hypothetical protein